MTEIILTPIPSVLLRDEIALQVTRAQTTVRFLNFVLLLFYFCILLLSFYYFLFIQITKFLDILQMALLQLNLATLIILVWQILIYFILTYCFFYFCWPLFLFIGFSGSGGAGPVRGNYCFVFLLQLFWLPKSRYSSDIPILGSSVVCKKFEWQCENGSCIDARRRCDGHIDCPFDFSDEFDCPPGSKIPCLRINTRFWQIFYSKNLP